MFLLYSCLTTVQPLPRQHRCKEGQLMLTQWQTWVVCTSPLVMHRPWISQVTTQWFVKERCHMNGKMKTHWPYINTYINTVNVNDQTAQKPRDTRLVTHSVPACCPHPVIPTLIIGSPSPLPQPSAQTLIQLLIEPQAITHSVGHCKLFIQSFTADGHSFRQLPRSHTRRSFHPWRLNIWRFKFLIWVNGWSADGQPATLQ